MLTVRVTVWSASTSSLSSSSLFSVQSRTSPLLAVVLLLDAMLQPEIASQRSSSTRLIGVECDATNYKQSCGVADRSDETARCFA